MVKRKKIKDKKIIQTFDWNLMPRMDYIYFLQHRISSHFLTFMRLPKKYNTFYLCLKKNGDLNGIMTNLNFSNKKYLIEADYSMSSIMEMIEDQNRQDAYLGQLGEWLYVYGEDDKLYYLYKIRLKELKDNQRKKITDMLKGYRKSDAPPTEANTNFYKKAKIMNILDPTMLYDLPNKRHKIFKNKIFDLNE